MTRRRLLIVLATDSDVPSSLGEHMLTVAGALSASHDVSLVFLNSDDAACRGR